MHINKVSQSIVSQTPDFIANDYPLFNKFIEYYYRSQEKTGLGQNIINEFLPVSYTHLTLPTNREV